MRLLPEMSREKKAAIIVQARMQSTRLPGKVMKDLGGRPMLEFMIERIKKCKLKYELIIATSKSKSDDIIQDLCTSLKVTVVRGSEDDVLDRYVMAAKQVKSSVIVRLTGDCPFIEPEIIDRVVEEYFNQNFDYVSNCYPPSFPDGLDVEVFSLQSLLLASEKCTDKSHREHVTQWMQESGECSIGNIRNPEDLSNHRWTVDEPEDLDVIRSVVSHFNNRSDFSWNDVIQLEKEKPSLFAGNSHFIRDEGAITSKGQKLWKRAKRVIPGGNMLLSKRAELFLPNGWPAYFSKSKGCSVWDLDGKKLEDVSVMGVGTNLLGYGNDEVDSAVKDTIGAGNMSTLNCPEEVYLAERLIQLHPWAQMARFARSGGEANAIAIRIARAATGRDTVAICGYHGWHDWYLATNLQNESGLKEHLLPGLSTDGIPKALAGTVQPFSFNRLDQLELIANNYNLAAVKMEVQRSTPPNPGFLEGVRKLCDRKGIVLIFDECTSGFRETFGGLHLKYNVAPDMAIFGKALGNGYAITAVIGKTSVMDSAQSSFISSTFWTERIGPTAALKTLEVMEREKSWEQVTSIGKRIQKEWARIALLNNLDIQVSGLPALSGFTFKSAKADAYKTFTTQEMLKNGFLATTGCYVCTAHTDSVLNKYFDVLAQVFRVLAECEEGRPIEKLLDGPICHTGFNRLN